MESSSHTSITQQTDSNIKQEVFFFEKRKRKLVRKELTHSKSMFKNRAIASTQARTAMPTTLN